MNATEKMKELVTHLNTEGVDGYKLTTIAFDDQTKWWDLDGMPEKERQREMKKWARATGVEVPYRILTTKHYPEVAEATFKEHFEETVRKWFGQNYAYRFYWHTGELEVEVK